MNIILPIVFLTMCGFHAAGQNERLMVKPTITIRPSLPYCKQRGYVINYDGKERCDQEKCAGDPLWDLVSGKIRGYMSERGFPVQDYLATADASDGFDAFFEQESSRSGNRVAETNTTRISDEAASGIILEVNWITEQAGPNTSVTFKIEAKDGLTGNTIRNVDARSIPTMGSSHSVGTMSRILSEAVLQNFDNFCSRLTEYHRDVRENGRTIKFAVKTFEGTGVDLGTEFQGKELRRILTEWMTSACVKGRYTLLNSSYDRMAFANVRIDPTINQQEFGFRLQDFLKSAPYNLQSKVSTFGEGGVGVIIGEK